MSAPSVKDNMVIDLKTLSAYLYASGMAIFTAGAEVATGIEPDKLVWMLGFAGALFGSALLPSARIRHTVAKIGLGWFVAAVASTPLAASHILPGFVNVHVAALWLGFGGAPLFLASTEGGGVLGRLLKAKGAA